MAEDTRSALPRHQIRSPNPPALGRNPASGVAGTATVPLIAPGTLYAGRLNQVDFRASKIFKTARGPRIQANVDLYNLLIKRESRAYAEHHVRVGLAATHNDPARPSAEVWRPDEFLSV